MSTVRCKFQLVEIRSYHWAGTKKLIFEARYDDSIPEDRRLAGSWRSGRLVIDVNNPVALEQYTLGEFYYFDSTPVK